MKKSRLTKLIFLIAIASVALYDIPKSKTDVFKIFKSEETRVFRDSELTVCFVDVGQGDCSVIFLPDGKIMMIDGGDNGHENEVFSFLEKNSVDKIDYLIATHPHSDHIGTLPEVINEYEIGAFYMPQVIHTSETFENMIDELNDKDMKINTAIGGKRIFENGDVYAEFVAPVSKEYEDLNNYSAVVRLVYKEKSFLFTGDMEILSEDEVLNEGYYINSDVLKVAHHASTTSSSDKFLKDVSPEYAVISCGVDNDYGHPHNKVLNRLKKYCNNIYRTDEMGTITMISDGERIEIN